MSLFSSVFGEAKVAIADVEKLIAAPASTHPLVAEFRGLLVAWVNQHVKFSSMLANDLLAEIERVVLASSAPATTTKN